LLEVFKVPDAASDPVFSVLPETARWLQWHTAEVTHLPASARLTASSDVCPIQAMSVGAHAASIQFHAEAVIERVGSWLTMRDCVDEMQKLRGEGAHERFIAAARKHLPGANRNAEALFTRWLEVNDLIKPNTVASAMVVG